MMNILNSNKCKKKNIWAAIGTTSILLETTTCLNLIIYYSLGQKVPVIVDFHLIAVNES